MKTIHLKRALRFALLVLLLNIIGTVKMNAQEFHAMCESGQILHYRVSVDAANEVALLGGTDWGSDQLTGNLIIPSSVVNDGSTYAVTSIEYEAFMNCRGLTSVTIGDAVTTILESAFQGCSSLVSINIPNSVTTIEVYAFYGTGWWNQNEGVLYLGSWCIGYKWDGPNPIPLEENLVIREGTKHIADGAFGLFNNSTDLISVIFPNTLISIGKDAFNECSQLTSVAFPNSLIFIGESAFYNCTGLTSVVIPNSVTYIGGAAFGGCMGVTSISIGKSLTSINGFSDCTGLTSITLPNTVTSIGVGAFMRCTGLTSVTLPNSVTSIGVYAFQDCTGLTSVVLPNALDSIGVCSFKNCTSLTSITIPKSVSAIGNGAFENCANLNTVFYNAENAAVINLYTNDNVFKNSGLTTLNIGADVRSIAFHMFQGCNHVRFVQAFGQTPAEVPNGAFQAFHGALVRVPCGTKEAYQSAWTMFNSGNIIEDCVQYPVSMSNPGTGGNITPSSSNAKMGEEVQLTITPDAGMALASISISNANDPAQTIPYYFIGKASSRIGFVMPPFGVEVTAVFHASGASVGENSSVEAVVYPNPTIGNVRIEASDLRRVSVFNALGQQVYEGQADGDVFEFDLTNHEAGIYLIQIETISGIATKRVVLTK